MQNTPVAYTPWWRILLWYLGNFIEEVTWWKNILLPQKQMAKSPRKLYSWGLRVPFFSLRPPGPRQRLELSSSLSLGTPSPSYLWTSPSYNEGEPPFVKIGEHLLAFAAIWSHYISYGWAQNIVSRGYNFAVLQSSIVLKVSSPNYSKSAFGPEYHQG